MKKVLPLIFAALISLSLFSCKHESSDSAPENAALYNIWEYQFYDSDESLSVSLRFQFYEDNTCKYAIINSTDFIDISAYWKGTYTVEDQTIKFNFTQFNGDNGSSWYDLPTKLPIEDTSSISFYELSLLVTYDSVPNAKYSYKIENDTFYFSMNNTSLPCKKLSLPSITFTSTTNQYIAPPDYFDKGYKTEDDNIRLYFDNYSQDYVMAIKEGENKTYYKGKYIFTQKNVFITPLYCSTEGIPKDDKDDEIKTDDYTRLANHLGKINNDVFIPSYSTDSCFTFNYDGTSFPDTITLTNTADEITKLPLKKQTQWNKMEDILFTQQ